MVLAFNDGTVNNIYGNENKYSKIAIMTPVNLRQDCGERYEDVLERVPGCWNYNGEFYNLLIEFTLKLSRLEKQNMWFDRSNSFNRKIIVCNTLMLWFVYVCTSTIFNILGL